MTPLEVLLNHLQVKTFIVAELNSNSCITATAHDANMRGYKILIPPDCFLCAKREEHEQALLQLEAMAGANLTRCLTFALPTMTSN
jgi:nicotinamidase-related amidase